MSPTVAIKTFIEKHPLAKPCTVNELKEFKTACTAEEWIQFGTDAAKALGVELDEPKSKSN